MFKNREVFRRGYLSQPGHFVDDGLVQEVVVTPVVDAVAQQELEHPPGPVDRQCVALVVAAGAQRRKSRSTEEDERAKKRKKRKQTTPKPVSGDFFFFT